jgi:hypothetical protein
LDFILELGDDYRDLMNFVTYEFLSSEGLSKFFDHFEYREKTEVIWMGFFGRLRGEKPSEQTLNRYRQEPSE